MGDIDKGCIVRSTAGRDKGRLFLVLAVEDGKALLVDGDLRKTGSPKSKNIKHIVFYSENKNEKILSKILSDVKLDDAEVRKAMRMLTEEVL